MTDIHIISSNKKWGVYKRTSYRSMKNFSHRDLAFHYATQFKVRIIVHNKNGTIDFIYDEKNKSKILD